MSLGVADDISVAGFLGEEEDDDYKDLYNDIDVGEGLLQSLHKNNGSRFQNDDVKENKPLLSLPIPNAAGVSILGISGGVEGVDGGGGSRVVESRVLGRDYGIQNQGFRGNEVSAKGGIRVELGNQSRNLSEIEDQDGNDGDVV
ncbi:hypothetical protein D0Y65_004447 [Glycine soja]|uniref:Uncharacterized protein n=1 Tax=Glycine soja TaxID=3848 RepID=A0A445LR60_GLYSO|nr:hypothetical protein D0Y65_004447 [Glycine soja]